MFTHRERHLRFLVLNHCLRLLLITPLIVLILYYYFLETCKLSNRPFMFFIYFSARIPRSVTRCIFAGWCSLGLEFIFLLNRLLSEFVLWLSEWFYVSYSVRTGLDGLIRDWFSIQDLLFFGWFFVHRCFSPLEGAFWNRNDVIRFWKSFSSLIADFFCLFAFLCTICSLSIELLIFIFFIIKTIIEIGSIYRSF